MPAVARSRRAEIRREAAAIRSRGQQCGWGVHRTLTAIRATLPEVSALEGWRLALGWSRAQTIVRIAALYRSDGLRSPALSESMLCRWEHDLHERPGDEYTVMLCRVYSARPEQLGLDRPGDPFTARAQPRAVIRYGRQAPQPQKWVEPMTTAAGLPAVRESLSLALLADPTGSTTVGDLAEAAVEHYALHYSKHPPQILFDEIHAARGLLGEPLAAATAGADAPGARELRRSIGYLSALLGNLALHLDDRPGARAHLATAYAYGQRTGDLRLTAWTCGARSMVALADHQLDAAAQHAERALTLAPPGLPRAQIHSWARLPVLAQQGRERDADQALAAALDELETDRLGDAPGRFGFDDAERILHEAEAHLALGRSGQAARAAEASAAQKTDGTPGWAAATLVLARAEATDRPGDAAQRALDVLDRVPPARLRSTARRRLTQLDTALTTTSGAGISDLRERLRALPAPVDAHGREATSPGQTGE
ncbi:Twin-arginine translocation pathway signal [Streptomyces chrestomyceticus]|uniref:Twin-arginine translocation pathway signal n=1 Tax=Streptomyces chrestomyceticus TaxID=68185 RepID=A0ABU7X626_9ACTN